MITQQRYQFERLTLADLGRLATWQSQPHVSAWWDSDTTYDQAALDDPRVCRWIVSYAGKPFAFMQDYTVHGWPDHHFAHLPEGTRGIDQYIGDPAMIGMGHGTAFISARVKALIAGGAPVVAVDPHPDNARAIAVYEKLGFAAFAQPVKTRWGLILPMKFVP